MMIIRDAKQTYSSHLSVLQNKKQSLNKLLKEQENGNQTVSSVDRVELKRELSAVEAEYEATRSIMDGIVAKENLIRTSESAKQQAKAAAKQAEELSKMMEVYRRIASGAKVPPEDEQKLMDYNFKLYMAAKTAAMLAKQNDKEYDSLWDDEEEDSGEGQDANEIAENTEVSVPRPETVAAEVSCAEE